MALGTIDTNQIASEAVTVPKVTDQVLSNRNILINGSARVHQRGNQATTNGGSVYFVDRFNVFHNSAAAVANLQQSTDTPSGQGFGNSMLIDVTTADTSIAAGEIAVLRQILEGQNLQQLKYGTSSAESLTLSFWVKSPKTGVHICELYHNDSQAKTQSQSYTISSANTWEKHSVTFSGDTAATLDNDNAYTIAVQWGLFAGTDYTSGTLQTTWANITSANRFVGQVNLFDSTDNNFYLTGVQLEVGVETPFEHEEISTTLRKCQRYFQEYISYKLYFNGTNEPSSEVGNSRLLPVVMRAVPTVGNKTSTHGSVGAYSANTHSIRYITVSSHGSGGFDVGFDLDAEL
tara:strand:- start:191 stop:1231 length:1041 start_codon:yes stop_codon:yes gene_type:complete